MSVTSRKTIFGSIAVGVAFVMELTLVPLLLPSIQEQFNLTLNQLAWVFNSYGMAVALGVLLGGWLGDAFNTKRVFALGVLFFASGSTVVAFAESYETIMVGRMMQGFGGGIFSPLVPILLTRAAPERPGRVLIIWGSVAGYVAASAPLFYSTILVGYGWSLAFIIFALVAIVAMVIVQQSNVGDEPSNDVRPKTSYAEILASRDLIILFVYVFCTYGSITYYLFRLPLWLSENEFQVASIGLTLSILWLSFSIMSTSLRNKVDAPHIRRILMVAPILIVSGFPLAYYCHEILCLALSASLVGAGLACSNAPSTQLILRFAPKGMSAASASLDITFARLGGVATVTLLAQSLFVYAALSVLALCVFAFLCALLTSKRLSEIY
jgi:MFS family permease